MEACTATKVATRTEARMEEATTTEVATWTEMPRWKLGVETWGQLTGPDRAAEPPAPRLVVASYPHHLLQLASSCGDESRENEIEFCVREERERDKKRGKIRFVITGVTGPELVVVVGPGFWATRLSSEFWTARVPRAHSLRVSAGYVSRYQK
jgi:hypothetical protein